MNKQVNSSLWNLISSLLNEEMNIFQFLNEGIYETT